MASNAVEIEMWFRFRKEAGDCSPCCNCGDQIFGNLYIPEIKFVILKGESKYEALPFRLCESCKDLIETDE